MVLVNLVVLEMMILAVSSGAVFRLWCLVYSQRKAPPVMITKNHDQELSVPLWSGDVGILLPGLCIRKNSCYICSEDGEVCKREFHGRWDWCDLFRLVSMACALDHIPRKSKWDTLSLLMVMLLA